MSFEDELLGEFVVESNEHLADVENQFLAIEEMGENVDVDLVNNVFRAIHSIKGAAGFLGMTKINDLAHSLENLLNMMRNLELTPTSEIVDVMLRAADNLKGLIGDIHNSNEADVSVHVAALDAVAAGNAPAAAEPTAEETPETAAEEVVETTAEANESDSSDDVAEAPAEVASTPEPEPESAPEPTPTPAPAAKAPAPANNAAEKKAAAAPVDTSIRVSVGLLDKLMNLAGELVLSRNQLMQVVGVQSQGGMEGIAARLDQITSELQESIMQTRMQQIGTVFGKFPRIVRDLGAKLNKDCELNIEGKEVEVDKTIVEAIGDPLTHLIRNSMDHGVETPQVRTAAGKSPQGTLNLRAFYQAGKVRIEIEDDGAGIDPNKLRDKAVAKGVITPEQAEQMSEREAVRLIFHPGFSMAAEVTDVSGRGVGMDVVRTNIAKLGGTVDVESTVGQGTNIVITLPLTLAIIPSLIVQVRNDRFAIPQVNIAELVRVRPQEIDQRLGRVKDAEVLRLRGALLPLVRLDNALGMDKLPAVEQQSAGHPDGDDATNIIVVESGRQRFGVVVDELHDSEEIVVKPLGRHIQDGSSLSGATILGDGHVALILDIAGLGTKQEIRASDNVQEESEQHSAQSGADKQSVLLFTNHQHESFAVCMDVVSRIERVRTDQIDSVGGQELVQYRSASMPIVRLEQVITAKPGEELDQLYLIVFEAGGKEIGLAAPNLEDIRDVPVDFDTVTFREPGVVGSLVINERATRLIDLFSIAEIAHPDWFEETAIEATDGLSPLILLAEDSSFFRKQVAHLFVEKGYRIVECEDGLEAWQALESGEHEFDLVVTDIEMPNMNGFELCRNVKQSAAHNHLPVIALTSLAGAADVQHGLEVGIDDYQIKMDRDRLLNAVHNFAGQHAGNNRPRQLANA